MAPLLIRGGAEWVGPQRMEVRRTDGKQGEGRENKQDANIRPLLPVWRERAMQVRGRRTRLMLRWRRTAS